MQRASGDPPATSPGRVVALAMAIVMLDGFDIQLAAFAAPALREAWSLDATALAPAITAVLFGMVIGNALGGMAGDRLGRRTVLIASVLWFGLGALLTAVTPGPMVFALVRFVTGIGLGAAFPCAAALAAETASPRWRGYAVTLIAVAMPLGGMAGALLAAWLIPTFGWRAAFVAGGALPMVLAVFLWRGLPRSRPPVHRVAAKHSWREIDPHRLVTIALASFATMLALYACIGWLPLLLADAGLPMATAIRGAMLFNLAGALMSFALTGLAMRSGWRPALLMAAGLGLVATAGLAFATLGTASPAVLLALVAMAGAGIFSLQVLLYGVAAHAFDESHRAAGIGLCASVGRIGSIASTLGAGWLIASAGAGGFFIATGAALVLAMFAVMAIRGHLPARSRDVS